MRANRPLSAVILGLCVLAGDISTAAPRRSHDRPVTIDDDSFYQAGIRLYAAGQRAQALGSFRVALRHHPGNRLVLTTIRRVEGELIAPPAVKDAPEALETSWLAKASDSFDELVLVDIPRAVNFNECVGDDLSNVGTLEALNGRVAQLLKERECALRHGRRFSKEREMRSLVRRLPTILA